MSDSFNKEIAGIILRPGNLIGYVPYFNRREDHLYKYHNYRNEHLGFNVPEYTDLVSLVKSEYDSSG